MNPILSELKTFFKPIFALLIALSLFLDMFVPTSFRLPQHERNIETGNMHHPKVYYYY